MWMMNELDVLDVLDVVPSCDAGISQQWHSWCHAGVTEVSHVSG
jgi:hypothetical protein